MGGISVKDSTATDGRRINVVGTNGAAHVISPAQADTTTVTLGEDTTLSASDEAITGISATSATFKLYADGGTPTVGGVVNLVFNGAAADLTDATKRRTLPVGSEMTVNFAVGQELTRIDYDANDTLTNTTLSWEYK